MGPHYQAGSNAPCLVMEAVCKRFGSVAAVDGVDLTVWPGEVVALIGPNGAGKTTTIELCEGFLVPDSGRIRVLGSDPFANRDRLRSRIGIMLQGGGGYPGVRAGEMLELAASSAPKPHDPRWLLDELGLASVARTKYRRLSGGERQRLSLACAIVARPEIVFLDEPSENLDPAGQRFVWSLVRALRNDGVTVIITTHAIDEVESVADRVVIVDRGRVIAHGTPGEVTGQDLTNRLTFSATPYLDLTDLGARLDTGYTVEESSPGRYVVLGPISPVVVESITSWGAAQCAQLSDLHVGGGRLEQTFMQLIRREMSVG